MISDILFLYAPVLAYHPKPIDAHSERAHRTGRLDGRPTFWNGRDAGLPVSRAILGRQIFSADGTPDAVRSSGDRPGGGDSGRATAMPIARRAREGRRRQVRPPTLRRSPEYGHDATRQSVLARSVITSSPRRIVDQLRLQFLSAAVVEKWSKAGRGTEPLGGA